MYAEIVDNHNQFHHMFLSKIAFLVNVFSTGHRQKFNSN